MDKATTDQGAGPDEAPGVQIPRGYMEDSLERLVPIKNVKPIDLDRDKVVKKLAAKAEKLSAALAEFRVEASGEIDAFLERSASRYGVSMAGDKGNVTLSSYDGSRRVNVAEAERLEFDEGLQVARKIVNGCLRRWSRNAKPEIKALVQDAFKVDQKGRLDARQILALRRLEIDDEEWKKAMQAISESVRMARSKRYLRIQKRAEDGKYELISLSLAGV